MSSDKVARAAPVFLGRRWFFPSALVQELDPDAARFGRRPRRTARDWVVDFTCFMLAVGVGLLGADTVTANPAVPHSLAVVDQVIGALSCAAIWLRRRWPLGLAAVMTPVSFVSETSGGVAVIALFSLAVHRPFRYVAWVGGVHALLVPLYFWWRPDPELPYLASLVLFTVLMVAVVGWGMFVRSKRQLMAHAAGTTADARRASARARLAALNDREREVAVAVGRGHSNAGIAAELYLSVATVKTHVSRILAKLDLNNRVQIALLAHDAGFLDGTEER
ncbi:response regulator transcription factor [Streptomyces sp. NPDC085927]|uniref:response regulator transcription factor n=1 Tax=Streptomyces sp. NPDC085927 TaxID=3365738 RepID=UPI0037D49870